MGQRATTVKHEVLAVFADDSPAVLCAAAVRRKADGDAAYEAERVTDAEKERILTLEEGVYTTLERISAMQKQMADLPRILKLVNEAVSIEEKAKLTNRPATAA